MKNLNMELLRTLATIEQTDNFTEAGRRLFKTQSAVTQQMQRLEAQIGFPLFRKAGRHRALTPQGQQLANYARRMLVINDEAVRVMGQKQLEGDIHFGAPLDVADTVLPSILTLIARSLPKIRMEIRVDRSPFLMKALDAGELDMTISTRQETGLEGFALRTSPTAWICAADYPYSRRAALQLILADEHSIFRHVALEALGGTRRIWRINYLAPTLVGIKAAVRAGLGVTARSIEFLGPDMRVLGEEDGLPPLPPMTYMLWMRKNSSNPLTAYLYGLIKEHFQPTTMSSEEPD